ncbi:hypothetical protein CDL12_11359 [Handroanthus impetiginosus]|uniref:Uncharacterized protein n=1 Tax=Handroanthus impetiginosus TaxID=429701 RepID=A0A2G9HEN7_9LAMI|nr:hypothetical protein CDL12_11359 [Handroanthus impetiginosus]
MDRSLKRKSELLSALATTNKTFDLKHKKLLSIVLYSANNMAVDSAEHFLPRRINAPNKIKSIGFPATKTFSPSNISSAQNRQAAVQENLGPEEVTEETLDTTSNVNVKNWHGLTISLNTQKYTKAIGEKPKLIILVGVNRPTGIHSSKHASMIGVLIKLEAPMQVEGWANISEDEREDLFLKLILDYEVDKPHVMKCICKSFAKQYATFRLKAHSYYKKMKAEGDMALARECVHDKLINHPDD